ncbi:hypothetical protein Sjap_000033 [Stephania japonica]|uniref:NAC domain-containing protein n=1 Tax=Stephania japonica TaxID=461633 RepID=A0AAP0KIU8_9MAGN
MTRGEVPQQVSVPPGFRFHPTEEELVYYYLRKKVAYESIDLDVIRDVDLNKLEPWDLKDKCRIGSGPQTEWYFFSHKDKKYPTGTRTNRATTAGFWKATGRDKPIHLTDANRIGMRKTLVFYTGRAPHGQKTDWIMHEYRLQHHNTHEEDDGWVVCRVFRKKHYYNKGFRPEVCDDHDDQFMMKATHDHQSILPSSGSSSKPQYNFTFQGSMHLPQLLSPESTIFPPSFKSPPPLSMNTMDTECSQNLMKLTSNIGGGHAHQHQWSFLDKLLASQQDMDHNPSSQVLELGDNIGRAFRLIPPPKLPSSLFKCEIESKEKENRDDEDGRKEAERRRKELKSSRVRWRLRGRVSDEELDHGSAMAENRTKNKGRESCLPVEKKVLNRASSARSSRTRFGKRFDGTNRPGVWNCGGIANHHRAPVTWELFRSMLSS